MELASRACEEFYFFIVFWRCDLHFRIIYIDSVPGKESNG